MTNTRCIKMFHPELRYLIQIDNGEVAPLFKPENLELMINIGVIALILTLVPILIYDITETVGKMCWSLLTPGQQWLEILMIVGAIGILVLLHLITNEVTKNLVKKFENLKEQNAEKVKRIAAIEEQNAELNKKIAELEKKAGGLNNVNIVEEDANMQNV